MAIFTSYATGDDHYVEHFAATLDRIDGWESYVAEKAMATGLIIEKIKKGIDGCDQMVAIITQNSIQNGIWQNQEIGYAVAKKKSIIPIKEEWVTIKGFLEGQEYIKLNLADLDYNSYELIARLRYPAFPMYFHAICAACNANNKIEIPLHEEINQAMVENNLLLYSCRKCKEEILVSPKSLAVIDPNTTQNLEYTPNYRFSNYP